MMQRRWGVGHLGHWSANEPPWRITVTSEDAARHEVWANEKSWLAYSDDGETWRDLDGEPVEVNEVTEDPHMWIPNPRDPSWGQIRRVSDERRPD
jgi:hypothetical protein